MSLIPTSPRETCILCGKQGSLAYTNLRDALFGVGGTWDMSTCKSCELYWLNPYPNEEAIGELYTTYYTHEHLNNDFLLNRKFSEFPKNKKIKYAVLKNFYGYKNLKIPKLYSLLSRFIFALPGLKKKISISASGIHHISDGKILDLGCGNGDFLLEMKYLGWEEAGLEVDKKAAQQGRNVGIHILDGILEKNTFEQNYFNIIHINNVIEHLPNPTEVLKICYAILKPGGTMIIKTCSNKSFAHRIFKENYRGLEIPRHYFIYSPSSLAFLGKKVGFTVEAITTSFNEYIWFSSYKLHTKQRDPAYPRGNKFIAYIIYMTLSIVSIFDKNKGDDIMITLKK